MAEFVLRTAAPFRLDYTVRVLRRRPLNDVDRWDGAVWRRVLAWGPYAAALEVMQRGTAAAPEVAALLAGAGETAVDGARPLIERILGLDVDLAAFHEMAARDATLAPLAERFVGFRPPRMASIFETILNAVACQQITLVAGLTLLNRLAASFGRRVGDHAALPLPVDLAGVAPQRLRALGFSMRKASNIVGLAQEVEERRLDLDALGVLDDEVLVARLCDLPGVGRWTAQYVALRGYGRLDVFPGDDVGGQKRIAAWLALPARPSHDGVQAALDPWRPWRGLMYFLLLLADQEGRPG